MVLSNIRLDSGYSVVYTSIIPTNHGGSGLHHVVWQMDMVLRLIPPVRNGEACLLAE
jgi:hypothetical protein